MNDTPNALRFIPGTKQQGITLLIVLVMLVLITMVTITSFKLGGNNLQAVGNMQWRNQVNAAAQQAIDNTISRPVFTTVPNVAVTSYASVANSGANDIQIVTTPTCVVVQPIATSSLNLSNANDAGCVVGLGQQSGIVGASSGNSMCANSVWNLQAVATDLATSATSTINQGVGVRVAVTASCP